MNSTLHEKLCTEMHELYVAKNKRYGDSFSKTVQKYGLIAALIRMEDKWNRIEELVHKTATESADESLVDTLMDLANYSLMVICEIKDAENKRAQLSANTSAPHGVSDFSYEVVNPATPDPRTTAFHNEDAYVDHITTLGPMSGAYDKYMGCKP